ncbi:hypothetical protein FQR65_LT10525 [Abscondita terminalis]|nr:hypothetical protein FQR65_LT10525 [Abscondita terminalis]
MNLEDEMNHASKNLVWFDLIPARVVLYLLALNGIAISFAMRVVINLTILAMVKEKPADLYLNATETLCYGNSNNGYAEPIGLIWPAMYSAISIWIPINERSRFVTCFQGLLLGNVCANLISGFIIVKFGWVYVFYCTGTWGLVSSLAWYVLMHDTPEDHPRISAQELEYIQQNREQCLHSEKKIPWISILKSIPVWAIGIAAFGRKWTTTFLTLYGPLYLKSVVGLPVEMNGLWMAVLSSVVFLSAFFFSFASDRIVTYKVMPLVYNRKLLVLIGLVVPGIMIVTMDYTICNITLFIVLWLLNQSFFAANFQGTMTNIIDVAPTYTGPVTCIVQVILLSSTLLCPLVTKTFLQNENTFQSWKNIFYTNNGVALCASILYLIFASGKFLNFFTELFPLKLKNIATNALLHHETATPINENGDTLLHLAALIGDSRLITYLHANNYNINSQNNLKNTPMHVAIQANKLNSVEALLRFDIDLELKNINGDTPLHVAASIGSYEIMTILLSGPVHMNSLNNYNNTPLHIAVQQNETVAIKLLMRSGADLEIRNSTGILHCTLQLQ